MKLQLQFKTLFSLVANMAANSCAVAKNVANLSISY